MEEMRKAFETRNMCVMIESVSDSGSAFGSTDVGESVFFNKRLVEKVELDIGDIVDANVIPNYEDKRHSIPWRAVRVSPQKDQTFAEVSPARETAEESRARSASDIDLEVMSLMSDPDVSYWTTIDLADAADTDTKVIGNACLRLFNKGRIAKADVHARHSQERASFCLWARNAEQFR